MTDSEKYIARFENVSFTYNKGVAYETAALKNLNLDIHKNCITGIIGATGSGKSTMIQMPNGLLRPDSGTVYIDGTDIHSKGVKLKDIRFKVGLVMQYPEYQLFDDTVESDIAFGPKNMGIEGEELKKTVITAARFAGLDASLLSKSPFDLSGGQKRRAALAGVIAMKPSLLLLDEPAAGLDPEGRREILKRIRDYQREAKTSVVIVSHSMEDVAKYCDRIAVLKDGAVVLHDETPKVFCRRDILSGCGLDVPEITKIAVALKQCGIDVGEDIYTVDYALEKITDYILSRKQ